MLLQKNEILKVNNFIIYYNYTFQTLKVTRKNIRTCYFAIQKTNYYISRF